ncbi:DinB family protein [Algoriphagus namhaensis]
MGKTSSELVWNQFGASIDMLIQAVRSCPLEYWEQNQRFYYIAFHSAIFLDYYLTLPPVDFVPVLSFTQKEPHERPQDAIDDLIPDSWYSREEVLNSLFQSREKCRKLIESTDLGNSALRFREGEESGDMDYPLLEILLYNLRHTQHHTAQLNFLLRQDLGLHMDWSFRAGDLEI